MIPDYKVCPKCNINKSKNEYHSRTDRGYTYLKSYCKECCSTNRDSSYDKCSCGRRKTKKSKQCQKCASNNLIKFETLEHSLKYRKKYGQSAAFAVVRSRAKTVMKHIKSCQKCGYDKHVEVCHIKPIASYDIKTPIDIINDPANLIVLCPNCHWEFDHQDKR